MEKRWVQKDIPNEEIRAKLEDSLHVSEALAILLGQRGISDFDLAKDFFRPNLDDLHDPFLMKDMDKAVDRVQVAIEKGEKILVYGDYDVDGTTAVSLFYSFLSSIHSACSYYIPDRNKEGYGISRMGIDYATEQGYSLMISLDCGVKSVALIQLAKDRGIDFIVCDHHNPGEVLPPAVAVLDAKRKDCAYPYKELSGCGVGFKLAQAIARTREMDESLLFQYLDLLAVSIACDIVEIRGENRILAFWGIDKLNKNPCPGLKVLLEKAFEKRPKSYYDITDILFYAGPRINAAGRLEHAYGAVDLLLEQDEAKAAAFASKLHTTNDSRKEFEAEITKAAIAQCEADPDFSKQRATVAFGKDWNKGVIGIVASRLVEEYYRPTIVLTAVGDKVAGSARSVEGFDIHEAIDACSEHLLQFGGHTHAAGLTMEKEKVPAFKAAFEKQVAMTIRPECLVPELIYDMTLGLKSISENFTKKMIQMAPFGPGNMNPLFVSRGVRDTGMAKTFGEHLSMNFYTADGIVGAMAFFQAKYYDAIKQGKLFDICYHIDWTEFNKKWRMQLRIVDMKPSET